VNTRGHLSSETIDLLLMAALTGDKESLAKAHISECAFCQKRWSELNEDKQRFEQFVFPRTVARLEERLARGDGSTLGARLRAGWKLLVPMGAVIAASVTVAVVTGGKDRTQTEDDVYIGIKGSALEVIGYRTDTGQFTVKSGAVLHPKDKIRFVVNNPGAKFLLIASRDGSGAFTVYHPFGSAQSGPLEPGKHELPGSVELDDVTGLERLVAVFSDAPISAEAVKAAMESNAAEPKIERAKVVTWEFVKEK
jgi:hypothetical protein